MSPTAKESIQTVYTKKVEEHGDPLEAEKLYLLEVWKQSIDIQKHFNDLSLKIRSTAVTALGAGLAATGLIVNENYKLRTDTDVLITFTITLIYIYLMFRFPLMNFSKHVAVWLSKGIEHTFSFKIKIARERYFFCANVVAVACGFWFLLSPKVNQVMSFAPETLLDMGGVCLSALTVVITIFYLLDKYWYHKSVRSAIKTSVELEDKFVALGIDDVRLAKNIQGESGAAIGNMNLDSNQKLEFIYKLVIYILGTVGVMLMLQGNQLVGKNPETIADISKKAESYRNEVIRLKEERAVLISRNDSLKGVTMEHEREHAISKELLFLYRKSYNSIAVDTTLQQ